MWKKTIFIIIKTLAVFFLLAVIAFSALELNKYNKGKAESRELAKEVVTETQSEVAQISTVSINFDKLLEKNTDVVGWLYCPDTPINYAIVQAEDNDYYLRRGLNEKYSYSGTLFADFRSSGDFCDKNTVIYGHNMKNDEMFGTLINYEKQEYFDKHPEMYLFTPSETYKIMLIAGIKETSTTELFETLLNLDEVGQYIKENLANSTFESGYAYSENDRFITLSTCSYDYNEARYIIFGKLEEV